jgi:TatA/E family protein of Tat protein translocase
MLSMTHMVVLFIVVLVVFGPHKLPELARGLGKLMAEFRKASTDFKSAFEQEMRDIERQALQAERKKAAEAAAASAVAAEQPATLATQAGAETANASLDVDSHSTEALTVTPVAESVPRSDGNVALQMEETPAVAAAEPADGNSHGTSQATSRDASHDTSIDTAHDPSHDQQQPV